MATVRRGRGRDGRWAGPAGRSAARHMAEPGRHGHGTVLALRALGAAVLALGLVIPWGPIAEADPPADPPTAQDARAAQDAVAAGTLDVRQAEDALAALRSELEAARIRVQMAAADYTEARQAAEDAQQEVAEARAAAEKAHRGEVTARASLAEVYRASARDADLGSLGVALQADSVPDLVGRSAAERAVQRKLGGALAGYQEARAASESADARWSAAKKQRDEAVAQAEAAYAVARTAATDLETRTRTAEIERTALVERLADLRQTSVRIEREREAARAAAAEAAREAAAQAELDRQRQERAAADAQAPDAHTPDAVAPEVEGPGPEGGSAEAEAPGGAAGGGGPARPPEEPAGGSSEGSGGQPAPAGPPPTGVTTGSAARGFGAVDWARTKLGAPYLLGAAGPTFYDCSGLTMTAWASQGVDITRTSRSQYLAVGKVDYASLRAGDLVFYGSDPGDPSSIYHVAMYTGGGMMIEATLPGHPVSENPLRLSGAMPYAGRP